jgi:hypothetical protein
MKWSHEFIFGTVGALPRCLFGVAQTSKSAVPRVSKPASRKEAEPTWKSAAQQVWKPALQEIGGFVQNIFCPRTEILS